VNFICFDLEGPLSPQDNAYELMKLTPNGDHIFELISRYDDLLTLEGREGYEPGDTLALIVPFLIYHHIPEAAITELAQRAALVNGAQELISKLNSRGWGVFCISTGYEQFAGHICHRVGIAPENLACTSFPLDQFHSSLTEDDLAPVAQLEQHILTLEPMVNDSEIKERLDHFFWRQLLGTNLGAVLKKVKPMGGQRKVTALKRFAAAHNQPLNKIIVIGDSITDFKMLKAVDEAGGLAIAFNANEYALPYATMGLASTDISDLAPALRSWEEGGKKAVEAMVRDREQAGGKGDRGHFHWLCGRQDIAEPLRIHKRIRSAVRQEAGKLG
jgi:energy-converting hydrogenase A subunit R